MLTFLVFYATIEMVRYLIDKLEFDEEGYVMKKTVALFMLFEKRNIGKPKKEKKIYTDEFQEKKIKGINC